jgi:hypothetical protein
MMVFYVGIEAFGASEYFNSIHDADLRKGQQRAVDRIERNVGIVCLYSLVDGIDGGMNVRIDQRLKNRRALGRHFKVMGMTDLDKRTYFI